MLLPNDSNVFGIDLLYSFDSTSVARNLCDPSDPIKNRALLRTFGFGIHSAGLPAFTCKSKLVAMNRFFIAGYDSKQN